MSGAVLPRRRAVQARHRVVALSGLALLVLAAAFASLLVGAMAIPPATVWAVLTEGAGDLGQRTAILDLRLPRTLMGLLVGASLGLGGAALQGLFRNPLADPALVGVSGGAALAAVTAIVLGDALVAVAPWVAPWSRWFVALAAFLGAMAAALCVLGLGRGVATTMLLAGIGVNALAMAGIGLLVFGANDRQLRDITFWNLGSVGGATWPAVAVIAPLILAAALLILSCARGLDALTLGDRQAAHLGVPVERLGLLVVGGVALAVGAAVSMSGIVGFVGLIVPHLVRLCAGPDHRTLLPGSALMGAALMVGADCVARSVVAPAELPVGLVTALIGTPFFLWLIRRRGAAA
ncbi:FecCD family ABC transporter permease [Azospirillum doebereinerae]|nr:iron ABC transporter permease [Azospirillum doebereinerae]MCG5243800.1 iron ABC transporter permease [Azospirillum doebereinerae]